MSKIALSPNAGGTATFTIASPNSNSDRTLNLPDNSGTVLTSASNLAGVTGVGKVLQVVQVTTTVGTATTSATYSDVTGLTASITPTSASSKVLVLVDYNIFAQSTDVNRGGVRLLRGATTVVTDGSAVYIGVDSINVASQFRGALNYLDSPSTTASTTYKIQFARVTSVGVNYSVTIGVPSNITLMEIAA